MLWRGGDLKIRKSLVFPSMLNPYSQMSHNELWGEGGSSLLLQSTSPPELSEPLLGVLHTVANSQGAALSCQTEQFRAEPSASLLLTQIVTTEEERQGGCPELRLGGEDGESK